MGVYIQSMEMPRDCWSCVMSSFGTCNFMGRIWDPDPGQPLRPDWCPLRPLPEKHGRLIDGTSLLDQVLEIRDEEAERNGTESIGFILTTIMAAMVTTQDTIVEAEGD